MCFPSFCSMLEQTTPLYVYYRPHNWRANLEKNTQLREIGFHKYQNWQWQQLQQLICKKYFVCCRSNLNSFLQVNFCLSAWLSFGYISKIFSSWFELLWISLDLTSFYLLYCYLVSYLSSYVNLISQIFLCAVEFGYLLVQYLTCPSFSHIFFLFGHQFIWLLKKVVLKPCH